MPKAKRTKKDYIPHVAEDKAPRCHVDNCRAPGAYKAPKSKNSLHEYEWFCLDHIREYNQKWDFFKDMDRDEIESFIKDAVTGHRPTWNREGRVRHAHHAIYDALFEFLHMDAYKVRQPLPDLAPKLRKALALLDLDYPYTKTELKTRYRELVKKYHPDVNKTSKVAEEKFKQITGAHMILLEHLKNN
jgi:hypothetical protein